MGQRKIYSVKKCVYWDKYIGEIEGVQVEVNTGENLFWVNYWLGRLKTKTAGQYAYKLVSFLNFLGKTGKSYLEANEKDLDRFIQNLRYPEKEGIFVIDSSERRRATMQSYISAISSFYITISNHRDDIKMPVLTEVTETSKYSFLYNVSWDKKHKKLLIDTHLERYKPKKNYVKWYTDKQIEIIKSNLYTYRDQAIFECTLCGMRIDEAISSHHSDYDNDTSSIVAYRSKGKETGSTGRAVALSKEAVKAIEDYLLFERNKVENELLKKGEMICDELFVGLKHNEGFGKPIKYNNFLKILKSAARRGGLDEKEIRTHSGRSTAVMRDLLYHADHPTELTLEDIRIKHGWSQLSSMEPYIDPTNPHISKDNRKRLDRIHNEYRERYKRKNGEED